MAADVDMAALLPMIKCSNCGVDVEISTMGEHICLKVRQPSPPPEPDQEVTLFDRKPHTASEPSRPRPLPRIDPLVANRPFMRPDLLTPLSSTGSMSPLSGRISPYRPPQRSHTSPLLTQPPSPELTNLDCAFPPFPTSGRSTPIAERKTAKRMVSNPRPRTGSSSLGLSVNDGWILENGRKEPGPARTVPPPLPPPILPPAESAQRRDHTPVTTPDGLHRRIMSTDTKSSYRTSVSSSRHGEMISRPSTANSHRRPSVGSLSRGYQPATNEVPPLPPSLVNGAQQSPQPGMAESSSLESLQTFEEIKEGYSGFDFGLTTGPKGDDDANPSATSLHWSSTMPLLTETLGPRSLSSRRPSEVSDLFEATVFPGNNESSQMPYQSYRPSGVLSQLPLQPISDEDVTQGYGGPASQQNGTSDDESLSVSNFARALDLEDNSHAADGSVSSAESSLSEAGSGSSMSSLQSDMTDKSRRKLSDLGSFDATMNLEMKRSMTLDEGSSEDNQLLNFEPPRVVAPTTRTSHSPTDPVIEQGGISVLPEEPITLKSPLNSGPGGGIFAPEKARPKPLLKAKIPVPDSLPSPSTAISQRRRCRGCGETIMGKSVSSADGRLTGRYHKACFVCHSCRSPFQTADFYVLNDHPYCAQHYHELNGSLCVVCNAGIEGQYVETIERDGQGSSDRRKFHPDCLKCHTCRVILRGEYFEWNGQVYCERDARRAAASIPPSGRRKPTIPSSPLARPPGFPPGPRSPLSPGFRLANPSNPSQHGHLGPPPSPRRFPERRTTKLMMI